MTGKSPRSRRLITHTASVDKLDLVMIEEAIDEKELAFLSQLEEHENEWVAFIEEDGAETVIRQWQGRRGSHQGSRKARLPDAILMKVPPFDRGFIPANFSSVPDGH